jgi:hypothetical protein
MRSEASSKEVPTHVVLPRNRALRNKIVCYINKVLAIMEAAHIEGYEQVRAEKDAEIEKLEKENQEIAALLEQYNIPTGSFGQGLDCGAFSITPVVNECKLQIIKDYMKLSDCPDMNVTFEEMEYAVLKARECG